MPYVDTCPTLTSPLREGAPSRAWLWEAGSLPPPPGVCRTGLLVRWVWVGRGLARGAQRWVGPCGGAPAQRGATEERRGNRSTLDGRPPAVRSSRRRCCALTSLSRGAAIALLVAPSWAWLSSLPSVRDGGGGGVAWRCPRTGRPTFANP